MALDLNFHSTINILPYQCLLNTLHGIMCALLFSLSCAWKALNYSEGTLKAFKRGRKVLKKAFYFCSPEESSAYLGKENRSVLDPISTQ